jgi:hypothetical protein
MRRALSPPRGLYPFRSSLMAISELTRLYFNYSGGVGLLVYGGILVFGVLVMPTGFAACGSAGTSPPGLSPRSQRVRMTVMLGLKIFGPATMTRSPLRTSA